MLNSQKCSMVLYKYRQENPLGIFIKFLQKVKKQELLRLNVEGGDKEKSPIITSLSSEDKDFYHLSNLL